MPRSLRDTFADRPFRAEAYEFVLHSLDQTIRSFDPPRHITGHELLKGLARDARQEFGPMAAHVLRHWGVQRSTDIGTIVFDLVDRGILARTEEDSLEDFETGDDFLGGLDRDYYRDHPGFADSGDLRRR